MRRTRESSWQYVLFLVPAIAAGVGIHYLVKKQKSASHSQETAQATSTHGHGEEQETGYRSLASRGGRNLDSRAETHQLQAQTRRSLEALTDDQDQPEEDLSKDPEDSSDRDPASMNAQKDSHAELCTSFELRGDGADTHVSNTEWAAVMDLFHESKANLQGWLAGHSKEFPGGLVKWMSEQVEGAMIQRPPVAEEPDLSWRGIGVIAHTGGTDGVPLIRIGGGFVKLVMTQPKRARFELTRLLAQSWSPCVLPTGAHNTWEPLLKCVGMKEQDWDSKKACAPGSESEGGWAVASAIAANLSPPGCLLPAFEKVAVGECLKKTAWLDVPSSHDVRVPASVSNAAKPLANAPTAEGSGK
jgi:hypothetical protein